MRCIEETKAIAKNNSLANNLRNAIDEIEKGVASPFSCADDMELYFHAAMLSRTPATNTADFLSDALQYIGKANPNTAQTAHTRVEAIVKNGGIAMPDILTDTEPEPVPEFPNDVFPKSIQAFVDMISESQQVDKAMVSCGVLATMAAVTMGKFAVKHPDNSGHWEHLALYITCIAKPSERKSGVLNYTATIPINKYLHECGAIDDFKKQMQEATAKEKAISIRQKALEKALQKNAEDKEKREEIETALLDTAKEAAQITTPTDPRFIASNCTPEALAQRMQSTSELAFLCSAEADSLAILSGLYNSGGASLDLMCKGKNGETTIINRIRDGGNIVLSSPLISILQMIQPGIWENITQNKRLTYSGFLARMLRCKINERETPVKYVNNIPVNKDLCDTYNSIIGDFLSIPRNIEALPLSLRFSDQAKNIMQANMQPLYDEQIKGGKYSDSGISEFIGKLPGDCARIAAILHLMANPVTDKQYHGEPSLITAIENPITAEEAQAACNIAYYFLENLIDSEKEEAQRFSEIESDMLKKIIEKTVLSGKAFCSLGAFKNQIRRNKRLFSRIDEVIQNLADSGCIEILTTDKGYRQKSRTDIYINPYIATAVLDLPELYHSTSSKSKWQ